MIEMLLEALRRLAGVVGVRRPKGSKIDRI